MDLYRDPGTMDPEELQAYLSDIRQELEAMDEDEPEDETSEEFKELPSQVWEQEPIKETYNHPDCAAGLAPLYAASDYKECVRETYTSSYPVSGYTCNFYLYHDYIALHSGKTGDAYSGKITFTKG